MNSVNGVRAKRVMGGDVVQVELAWVDAAKWIDPRDRNVLEVKEVKPGQTLALGERGDLVVPETVLGTDRAEIVRFDGETAMAFAPAAGRLSLDGWPSEARTLEITRGHVVEVVVGSFVARLSRVQPATRPAALAPMESLKRSGLGVVAGSAVLHAAVFSAMAFLLPALGGTDDQAVDRDRIELMQSLLNAHAQHDDSESNDSKPGDGKAGDSQTGETAARDKEPGTPPQSVAGPEGPKSPLPRRVDHGKANPEDATAERDQALKDAADFGLAGLLPPGWQSPDGPKPTWGRAPGSDAESAAARYFGGSIDDGTGTGGLTLNDSNGGSGGPANVFGITGMGGMGSTCVGTNCVNGHGSGFGPTPEGYHHKPFTARDAGPVTVGGTGLSAEAIQRVVHQNFGRFRMCYEQRHTGGLEGHVTTKFVIAPDGTVTLAADGGSDFPDAAVTQCVVQMFTTLSFPSREHGQVTVIYPILFEAAR